MSTSSSSVLKDYEVLATIGQGSYGCCRKVKRKKDGRILVWKELFYGEMSETEKQLVVSEVNLLREFRHPNIVRYYDRIIDRSAAVIYIIMEYCEGGDLSSFIKRCKERKQKHGADEAFVWRCLVQLCSALRECHCRSAAGRAVLHRDLKPANVFLDRDQNIKLGDFGLARVLQHDNSFAKTFVGTPYYMSPEQMHRRAYNEKSDIWSLGCLIYEMCALHPPFLAKNQRELAVRIRRGLFCRLPLIYSDRLQSLVESMLQVNEAKRPSIEELYQVVNAENATRSQGSITKDELKSSGKCPQCGNDTKETTDDGSKELLLSLRRRENDIHTKEEELKKRLHEILKREKAVSLMEKVAEDKMKKADSLIRQGEERLKEMCNKALGDHDQSIEGDRKRRRSPAVQGATALQSLGDFSPISSPSHSPLWYRKSGTPVTPTVSRPPCLKKDQTINCDSPRDSTPRKTVTFLASGLGPCPIGISPTSQSSTKRTIESFDDSHEESETDENVNPLNSNNSSSATNFSSMELERKNALRQRWERARVRSEMLEKLEKEIIERCHTVLKISADDK